MERKMDLHHFLLWVHTILRNKMSFARGTFGAALIALIASICAFLLTGADPSPGPQPVPTATLELKGELVTVLIAACAKMETQYHTTCGGNYVRHANVELTEYESGYVVSFRHDPPRYIDDDYIVMLKKPIK